MDIMLCRNQFLFWTLFIAIEMSGLLIFPKPPLVKGQSPYYSETGNKNRSDFEIDFNTILTGIVECDNHSLLLISSDNVIFDLVSNHVTQSFISLIHFEDNFGLSHEVDFKTRLRDLYVIQSNLVFLIDVQAPDSLLSEVDYVARQESHGELALMRHKTHWLVLCRSNKQIDDLVSRLNSTILDNIAIVRISNTKILSVSTLKWASKTERMFQDVNMRSENGILCHSLFPNKRFGLNGRVLKVLAKSFYKSMLRVVTSDSSENGYEYTGIAVNVLRTMAKKLNFSFVIHPQPGSNKTVSWSEYRDLIGHGTYDVGLNLWSDAYAVLGPHRVTYPIAFDVITGLYHMPAESERSSSIILLFPFHQEIYIYLSLCLFHVAFIYVITVVLSRILMDNSTHEDYKNNHLFIIRSFLDIVERLTSSLMNQSYLPRPQLLSARLLLGFWSLTVVIIYALYSGFIIARMVKQAQHLPFNNYQEMIDRGDYVWIITENGTANDVMIRSRGILKTLQSQAEQLPSEPGQKAVSIVEQSGVSTNDNVVFLYFKMAAEDWLAEQPNPQEYIIMEKYLLLANGGFLLASRSELEYLLSDLIVRMHETGLLIKFTKIHKSHMGFNRKTLSKSAMHVSHKNMNLNRFFWPFILVSSLALAATFLLVGEVLVLRWRARRKRSSTCSHDG